ncbi:hypothetical protein M513_03058 [Trichuris suis]|uniref:Protein TANC2 n=1 Tax=Trichuris suis TaxID=68888 RepID=A0A085MFD8_9BILA|nr:hypothetical protein M513_03058 [Trichuris suis]
MKLWGKLFHFGGNANSSVRQETHCQHVVPLGDGGTVYFGLYGSIRRRRSSKLPYTASSKSASASPCCQRAPSTIELLQDQQKRLATIAATPRMARALQTAGRSKSDATSEKAPQEIPSLDKTAQNVIDLKQDEERVAESPVQPRRESNSDTRALLEPKHATVTVRTPQLSRCHASQFLSGIGYPLATVSEAPEASGLDEDERSVSSGIDQIEPIAHVPPPVELTEKQLTEKLSGILNLSQRLRRSGPFASDTTGRRFSKSPSLGLRSCSSSTPGSPWVNEARSSMPLERRSRRPSQESLMSLMSSSSAASYVNYKPCCHQARQRHKSPSSGGGSSSRSSVTEFSFDGRHRAYRRSTKQLCVKTGGTPASPRTSPGCYPLSEHVNPMTFELPVVDSDELFFINRSWLFHELLEILVHPCCDNGMKGAVIYGCSGSGKTTIVHHLAAASPVQQPSRWTNVGECVPSAPYDSPSQISNSHFTTSSDSGFLSANSKPNCRPSAKGATCSQRVNLIRDVADTVIAYHFCQIESEATCSLPLFLHNLASMIAVNPRMSAYADLLASDNRLQRLFNLHNFYQDPVGTFRTLLTEPLNRLHSHGKLPQPDREQSNLLILVDAIDEAEFHRPDSSDSIGSFLVNHGVNLFPPCVKFVLTVRAGCLDLVKGLPLHKIDLDESIDERLYRDSFEYVSRRVESCLAIQSNITSRTASMRSENVSCPLGRFIEHLASVAKGCFLYMRLVLDLVQQNYIVVKGTNYRVLPINLSEAFTLMLSLRFSTEWSFRQVAPLLEAILASLRPLTSEQLYGIVNANIYGQGISWDEYQGKLNQLQEFVVQTQNGTYLLFHPIFREWLIRRESGKGSRFLCDVKNGHASIALWLTRRCRERSLNAEDAQELGHHLLKAHVFKHFKPSPESHFPSGTECQLFWLNHSVLDIKQSLCSLHNVFQPNTKVSKLLLLAGANANSRTRYYNNAPLLCVSARQGLYNFAALLLDFGADVDATDDLALSPIMHAAIGGHLDLIQILHEHGAEAIHAAQHGHINVVSFLLQCDWSPCSQASYPIISRQQVIQQAFVMAAQVGQISVCKFLFDFYDVDVDALDPITGETAIGVACSAGNKDTVLFLLDCHASVHETPFDRAEPPLLKAVKNGCWEIVSALLAKGVDVNTEIGSHGQTALMYAAQCGHIGVMELLLGRDANVHLTDNDNRSALAWACIGNQEPCANLLLERGARLSEPDVFGNLPIHYAAQYGSKDLLQLFTERRVSLEHVNSRGMRPLEVSIEADNFEAFQRLLRHGAKLGPQTWNEAYKRPQFTLKLLEKLLEDGFLLYKMDRLKDATHRFHYAMRKLSDKMLLDHGDCELTDKFRDVKYNLLLGLARCRRRVGEASDAVQQATSAVQLNPDRYEAYFVRARCQCESKNWIAAQSDFQKALRLCPDNKDIERSLDRLKAFLHDPSQIDGSTKRFRYRGSGRELARQSLVDSKLSPDQCRPEANVSVETDVISNSDGPVCKLSPIKESSRKFHQPKWKDELKNGVETEL